jgi:hypothetical protein
MRKKDLEIRKTIENILDAIISVGYRINSVRMFFPLWDAKGIFAAYP